jgi:hypothetical protein
MRTRNISSPPLRSRIALPGIIEAKDQGSIDGFRCEKAQKRQIIDSGDSIPLWRPSQMYIVKKWPYAAIPTKRWT